MKKIVFSLFLATTLLVSTFASGDENSFLRKKSDDASIQIEAAMGVILRTAPSMENRVELSIFPEENSQGSFKVKAENNRLYISATDGISLCSGFHYYLREVALLQISRDTPTVTVPSPLVATRELVVSTPYEYRYHFNYCTFGYTMVFWGEKEWQQEIDWMALNGINLPLALTGEETVWRDVYKEMGLSDQELDEFFTGPSFLPWSWMGNLDNWGGPLLAEWFEMQKDLQRFILDSQRRLGMSPVLPAFSGHVPEGLKTRFPKADIRKGYKWNGFEGTYLLLPQDPLFQEIGVKFLKKQEELYGTDHYYSSDTFNENKPIFGDRKFLKRISSEVYKSMEKADPKAVWVMQGWLFLNDRDYWNNTRIKALLSGVRDDRMIILDLFSTAKPVWNTTDAYFGKTWVYCMLHNWGGKQGMYGRLDKLATEPSSLLSNPAAGALKGIGLTPEGLNTNPVVYDLFYDAVWNAKREIPGFDLEDAMQLYQERRYGIDCEELGQAWKILEEELYTCPTLRHGPQGSYFCMRPSFITTKSFARAEIWYNIERVYEAFKLMLVAVEKNPSLAKNQNFRYDLADLGRQVLSDASQELHKRIVNTVLTNKMEAFEEYTAYWLEAMDINERLVSDIEHFRLEHWTAWALNRSDNPVLQKTFLFNAKNLITLWGPQDSKLHDYAQRQYAGMFSTFYKPRWEMFFDYCEKSIIKKTVPSFTQFEKECSEFEWEWSISDYDGSDIQHYDTVKAALELNKFMARLKAAY